MWRNGQDLNELDEPILLLEPKNHPECSNSRKKKSKNLKPNTSFVGGQAIFYPNDQNITSKINSSGLDCTIKDNDNETKLPQMKCDNCHDPMYLLLQMYAPLDDLERTLYVFGCNKASCFQVAFSSKNSNINNDGSGSSGNSNRGDHDSSKSRFCLGGMGVVKCLRSQQSHEVDCKDNDDVQPSTSHDEKNKTTNDIVEYNEADNNWGDIHNDDHDGWSDTGGGWGDETEDGGWGDFDDNDIDLEKKMKSSEQVSMDDLEAMLSAMEAKEKVEDDNIDIDVQSSSSVRIGNEKTTSTNKSNNLPTSRSKEIQSNTSNNDDEENKIPSYSFPIHELETYNEPSSKIEGMQQMEEDDDDMIGLSSNGRDDSKVQRMLSSYLKEEEDETVKAMIGGNTKSSSKGSTSTTGGKQMGHDEKYERLPPDDRAFLSFTDRIKRAPYQVARYAYDGVPMWSIPTPLTTTGKKGGRCRDTKFPSVPKCKCGANRTFEFQLMPSILHLLDVDSYCINASETSIAPPSTSKHGMDIEQAMNKETGGMNWGTVAVYSCPDSCSVSNEEFVIIQESVDANPEKAQVQFIGSNEDEG